MNGVVISLSSYAATLTVCADELLNLHRGQGMELYWRDALECPTEEEYLQMVNNSLFYPPLFVMAEQAAHLPQRLLAYFE